MEPGEVVVLEKNLESSEIEKTDRESDREANENVTNNIRVFARIRPPTDEEGEFNVSTEKDTLKLDLSISDHTNIVDNTRTAFSFAFDFVFSKDASQDEVFQHTTVPIIEDVINGYNGTLFAYGQTGSGKTYTLTGGKTYNNRGIMPRALKMIFDRIVDESEYVFSVRVSYLEIYGNVGYDLLSRNSSQADLSSLPKVHLREDEFNTFNPVDNSLKSIVVPDQNAALNQLFVGDTNRVMCRTPSNDTSTRSHCIFTIYIESREAHGDKIRNSKLHFVDLAGSERVSKTGVSGRILEEVKFINSSLHHLARVIVALQDNDSHIPYRDSMLTKFLKDSLGGNCKTTMISTVSINKLHIDESISTCRFAQRVAKIQNLPTINEVVDPYVVIEELRSEIKILKQEILALRGEELCEAIVLSSVDLQRCKSVVSKFLEGLVHVDTLAVHSYAKICGYLTHMKDIISGKLSERKLEDAQGEDSSTDAEAVNNCDVQNSNNIEISEVRALAFETFKSSSSAFKYVSSLKKELRDDFNSAKSTATDLSRTRNDANLLRAQLEEIRVKEALSKLSGSIDSFDGSDLSTTVGKLQMALDELKQKTEKLKSFKEIVEHKKCLLQRERVKLCNSFETFFHEYLKNEFESN
eukprot:144963_1